MIAPSRSGFADWLQRTIWPVPSLLILLALAALWFTIGYFGSFDSIRQVADGEISDVLSVIATTLFSALLILFSITMMVLALSANQYGSRLLRYFMQNLYNQLVIGYCGATYVFCLVLIYYGKTLPPAVSQICSGIAILLAIGAIFLFTFFIHNVTQAIQAPNIIRKVGRELKAFVGRLSPFEGEEGPPVQVSGRLHQTIRATDSGYLQEIDHDALVQIALDCGGVLEVLRRPGDYVMEGLPIAKLYSDQTSDPKVVSKRVNSQVRLGESASLFSDLEMGIRHLMTIALRALSPSVIDHFNATNCIDELAASTFLASSRCFADGLHYDEAGALRLQTKTFTYHSLVEMSFNQIRQNAAADPSALYVTLYLADTLMGIAAAIEDHGRATLVAMQVDETLRAAENVEADLLETDRKAVGERRSRLDTLVHIQSNAVFHLTS